MSENNNNALKTIKVEDFTILPEYLPFLIQREGELRVHVEGYVDGKINLAFKDGLKGSFKYTPDSDELKKALFNKGWFVIIPESNIVSSFVYIEKPKIAPSVTSRSGSFKQRSHY